jgi:hypothetical protein
VEKRRDSADYFVNGRAVADSRWLLRTFLMPTELQVLLGLYLICGSIYVVLYRRSPLADLLRARATAVPAATPHRLLAGMCGLVVPWLLLVVAATILLSCVTAGFSGLVKLLHA